MTQSTISYDKDGNARSFVGTDAVNVFAAAAIASAINLYVTTGMKANRAYTPKAMRERAEQILGKKFKHSELAQAGIELRAWVQQRKAEIPAVEAR